ncbi:hypothetical protein PVAP13_2NG459700 [Panicum virgatum]|uniref:Uncharacterized protein n=1 Tax=Panicum virgatum TaxID=38727 RepID=A0A8T0V922_PANVG|nr:hypothetical protein PVAP13_2NG459700 [Panicum virgatum]
MRSRPLGLSHVLRPKCLPLSTGGSSGASSNLERYINTISHVCSVSKASIGVQATVGSGCIEKKRKEKKEVRKVCAHLQFLLCLAYASHYVFMCHSLTFYFC